MAAAGRFDLTSFIDEVARQLLAAEEMAKQRDAHVMQFEECELEMAVSLEKDGKGGIKVWVIELGGGAKKTDSNTIRVKFSRISGQRPAVFFAGDLEAPPLPHED